VRSTGGGGRAEHVDEDDDGGDVVERKQKHADSFHDAGGVLSARKHVCVATLALLARVLDLHTVHSDQSPPTTLVLTLTLTTGDHCRQH